MNAPVLPARRPRLVVVGARRARNGTGAWLARHLAAAGAEVVAVVGSRLVRAQEAAAALAPSLGHRPVALAHSDDVERLPDLDAIAIASPHETHEGWLKWAVGRGLSALCEKPLVWGGPDAPTTAAALARRFAQRGLHLRVLTQWPAALEGLVRLHPGLDLARAERLTLGLFPPSRGTSMVPDALPHALSIAYALLPHARPKIEDVTCTFDDELGRRGRAAWTHVAGARRLAVEVTLEEGGASPRPFSIDVDGCAARREVDASTYSMSLVDRARSVPLPDPYAACAAAFVRRLAERAPPEPDPSALHGVAHLAELAAAFPALPVTEIPYP